VPGYSVQPDLAPRAHAEAKRARAGVRTRVVEARNEHNLARRDKIGRQRAGPHDSAPAFLRPAIADKLESLLRLDIEPLSWLLLFCSNSTE
jgi:hypothetical protein